jgi:hypothetical protein
VAVCGRQRKKFEQSLGDIREERKKYRAMLYDAIKERDDLLESRQISKIEERIAKNRARPIFFFFIIFTFIFINVDD